VARKSGSVFIRSRGAFRRTPAKQDASAEDLAEDGDTGRLMRPRGRSDAPSMRRATRRRDLRDWRGRIKFSDDDPKIHVDPIAVGLIQSSVDSIRADEPLIRSRRTR